MAVLCIVASVPLSISMQPVQTSNKQHRVEKIVGLHPVQTTALDRGKSVCPVFTFRV